MYQSYLDGSNSGTDWIEAIRNKNAVTTSHSLNVTGGSERSKFSIGAGYQYQDGVLVVSMLSLIIAVSLSVSIQSM